MNKHRACVKLELLLTDTNIRFIRPDWFGWFGSGLFFMTMIMIKQTKYISRLYNTVDEYEILQQLSVKNQNKITTKKEKNSGPRFLKFIVGPENTHTHEDKPRLLHIQSTKSDLFGLSTKMVLTK